MPTITLPIYYVIKRKTDNEVLFMIAIIKEKFVIDDTNVLSNLFRIYRTEKITTPEYLTYTKAFDIAVSVEPEDMGQVIIEGDEMKCLGVAYREVGV